VLFKNWIYTYARWMKDTNYDKIKIVVGSALFISAIYTKVISYIKHSKIDLQIILQKYETIEQDWIFSNLKGLDINELCICYENNTKRPWLCITFNAFETLTVDKLVLEMDGLRYQTCCINSIARSNITHVTCHFTEAWEALLVLICDKPKYLKISTDNFTYWRYDDMKNIKHVYNCLINHLCATPFELSFAVKELNLYGDSVKIYNDFQDYAKQISVRHVAKNCLPDILQNMANYEKNLINVITSYI
jgi:hypothetical protein